ncbi:hypothetical protein CH063_02321 [Colletotrichum higginsianum]|uniref:NACHT-NTPase and P-loop NTPases N-terminal domain-containing protein n=1 Tax=Colletotrichum higginsianum (strain IMI 349063) TaxID=759273 RepID=H1VJA5_COLHI|nr:hypothetical protein CH063_02321 [Colletotrichum higginsianum]
MAEVFGVVVSALTVAEMAGKFGASIVKLKKLWDEVQDVPNEIAHLVRQLEILRPVLAEMEAEFSQRTHRVHRDSAANLSMEYCQQAVGGAGRAGRGAAVADQYREAVQEAHHEAEGHV